MRNPLGKPSQDFAVVSRSDANYTYVYILDLDPHRVGEIEDDLVGGVVLRKQGPSPQELAIAAAWGRADLVKGSSYVVSLGAAAKGYGPLVYDITATVLNQEIYPSKNQSAHAQRLWKRYGGSIPPMGRAEFREKYGVSLRHMVLAGRELEDELTPRDWKWMFELVGEVASTSWEASKEGRPLDFDPLHYEGGKKYRKAIARRNRRRRKK